MANALTCDGVTSQINAIHQFLHGYEDGHRLIEGSLKLPNDVARLMLRMSDLSGSSVVKGFERYLTGYPLDSIDGYALAMTWYASEMPRPGSVWTHTLALPAQTMAAIPSLGSLIHLFTRPSRDWVKGQYSDTLSFPNVPINYSQHSKPIDALDKLNLLFFAYYTQSTPVVVAARNSDDFIDAIMALWSQQWPSLRRQLAFCTGSLSSRSLHDRPFDIQCSPPTLARDVAREAVADSIGEPVVFSDRDGFISPEMQTAVEDAAKPDGGAFRRYLWMVTDASSRRTDFISYARIFEALDTKTEAATIVELIAQVFPEPTAASGLKLRLVGSNHTKPLSLECPQQDILLALATTEKHSSFSIGSALNDELAARLFAESPDRTRRLVADLFRSNLNPLGDELLTTLVRAMGINDAQEVVSDQPQFLPALVRVNPDLAVSTNLWSIAGDRRHEVMDSLIAQDIRPELVDRIVSALLDSGSDGFLRGAFERWGKDAAFAALDWTENHQGSMSETCRQALTFQIPNVMSWIESGSHSTPALMAAAHVVAPYCYQVSKHDSSFWRRAFNDARESGKEEEATYLQTFLLGLALRNAPPAPLDLIGECFEAIHRKVSWQQLRYDTWLILEPLVPELSWRKNWDKCERMRRGLLVAFMQNSWPAWEIKERIKDRELLRQILKSVRKVHGEHYFYDIYA